MNSGLVVAWDIVTAFWSWYWYIGTIIVGVVVGIVGPFWLLGHLFGYIDIEKEIRDGHGQGHGN